MLQRRGRGPTHSFYIPVTRRGGDTTRANYQTPRVYVVCVCVCERERVCGWVIGPSGPCAAVYNWVHNKVIAVTSATTTTVLGNVKAGGARAPSNYSHDRV